jgi:hypothetical protein
MSNVIAKPESLNVHQTQLALEDKTWKDKSGNSAHLRVAEEVKDAAAQGFSERPPHLVLAAVGQ